jgi:hypothetical protein
MSLATRLGRVERWLGGPGRSKHIILSTLGTRHEVKRIGVDAIALLVPWRAEYADGVRADPFDDLTEHQRSLIGSTDKITWIAMDPAEHLDADPYVGL